MSALLCHFHMKKALQEAAKKRTCLIGDKSARIAVFTSMDKLFFKGNQDEQQFKAV